MIVAECPEDELHPYDIKVNVVQERCCVVREHELSIGQKFLSVRLELLPDRRPRVNHLLPTVPLQQSKVLKHR